MMHSTNPGNDELSILSLLAMLGTAYRDRQPEKYLAFFSEPAFVFGTAIDEKCRGLSEIRAHLERDWAQSASASFTLNAPQVTVSGPFAWVASDCRFDFRTAESDGSVPGRASFVLQQTGGDWKIQHAHFSAPTPADPGKSF